MLGFVAKEGFTTAIDELKALSDEIGAISSTVDASQLDEVEQLFTNVEQKLGVPALVGAAAFLDNLHLAV